MVSAFVAALVLAPTPIEVVYRFHGSMPTGVTVSPKGRIFVTFPRWGDPVVATLGEVRGRQVVPYPNKSFNLLDKPKSADHFVSVQSAVIDPAGRLWAVDTGSIRMNYTIPGGPKLVCFDLDANKVERVYRFPEDVVLPTTYLNDVRFDLTQGQAGYAFITDSSDKGPNGIIVVDLASGKSWRRLHNHPATRAEPFFVPKVEGQPVMVRPKYGAPQKLKTGADGIAIDPERDTLYFCPLVSRHLFSVPISALIDQKLPDRVVGTKVIDLGFKGASDGLICDATGTLFVTDYQNNNVKQMIGPGRFKTVIQFGRGFWPDTLSIGPNGSLYAIANQLQRQSKFQRGVDRRTRPYELVSLPMGLTMQTIDSEVRGQIMRNSKP